MPATSASAIPGQASCRPFGAIHSVSSISTTRNTTRIPRPKTVHIVPDRPKTRSGKIMRRVLAAISNQMDTGDITTLANPDIVAQIREQVQGRNVGPLREGPEDIKRFGDER